MNESHSKGYKFLQNIFSKYNFFKTYCNSYRRSLTIKADKRSRKAILPRILHTVSNESATPARLFRLAIANMQRLIRFLSLRLETKNYHSKKFLINTIRVIPPSSTKFLQASFVTEFTTSIALFPYYFSRNEGEVLSINVPIM